MNLACTTSRLRPFGAALLSLLVVGVGAGAAVADPPSQPHNYFAQGIRPDDRAGIHGANGPAATAVDVQTTSGVRPDDRGGIRGPGDPSFTTAPAPTSVTGGAGQHTALKTNAARRAQGSLQVGAASNFDWGDAGVGAGSTLGLVLLAGGLVAARGRLRARVVHA
jgi:hypothetical protein